MFNALDKLFAYIWNLLTRLYESILGLVTWVTGNRRASLVALSVIILVPAGILVTMFTSGGESDEAAAWREYFHATAEIQNGRKDINWFIDLITEGPQDGYDAPNLFKGTDGRLPKLWAFQFIADTELSVGIRLLYNDKDAAGLKLLSALGHYEYILETAAPADGLLQPRALLGQAAAAESLMACTDVLNEAGEEITDHARYYDIALQALERIQSLDLDSATISYAKQRADTLRAAVGDELLDDGNFLQWLAAFTPVAAPLPEESQPQLPPAPGELLPPPVLNTPLTVPEPETTPPVDDKPEDPPAEDDADADPADSDDPDAPSESQDE